MCQCVLGAFVGFCICLAKVGRLSIHWGKVALYQLSYFRV